MTSAPNLIASAPPSPSTGWRAWLAKISAFVEAIDGDHFAAPEVRIRNLEARIAQLELAAHKEN